MSDLDKLFDDLKKEHNKETLKLENSSIGDPSSESFIKDISNLSSITKHYSEISNKDTHIETKDELINVVPLTREAQKVSKKQAKLLKEATSGDKWFNMPRGNAEDPKNKKDLMIIQQRAVLDPKRHYKKDKWVVPKYFQMGTIVEDNTEFFSARLKRKEREQTLLQEVLHDKDSTKYFKRKYNDIQEQKSKVIKYKSKRYKNRR